MKYIIIQAGEKTNEISDVLHPLPKLPVMVCYWRPDDGLGSCLSFYFDDTADKTLDIESIFYLGAGITQMFGKRAERHLFDTGTSGYILLNNMKKLDIDQIRTRYPDKYIEGGVGKNH
jgi:hypothetical protein